MQLFQISFERSTGLVFSEYLLSGQIPPVKEVNDVEPFFPSMQFPDRTIQRVSLFYFKDALTPAHIPTTSFTRLYKNRGKCNQRSTWDVVNQKQFEIVKSVFDGISNTFTYFRCLQACNCYYYFPWGQKAAKPAPVDSMIEGLYGHIASQPTIFSSKGCF